MDIKYIILGTALIWEIALRLYPTTFNFSFLDRLKNTMLALHNLVDIVLPNNKKDVQ
jgi:hypothetical protein